MRLKFPMRARRWVVGLVAICCWAGLGDTVAAQRRPAAELLPEETLVYLRIGDVKTFLERSRDTAMGRMLNDPEVSPLVENLYGMATDEYEAVRERTGLSLDELLSLPQGELCFALVRTKEGDQPMAPVFLLDVGDSADLAETLVQHGEMAIDEQGSTRDEEDYEGTMIRTVNPNDPDERLVYFRRDTTWGFSNDPEVVRALLARWNVAPTSRDKVFSNNRKFVTIMNRCSGTSDARPDLTFFVDPYGIFQATQSGVQGAVATAFAKSLGVDGFLGIGGSAIMGVDGFESISHMHVLLASPRIGVVKMLAMADGPIEPPSFVPASIVTYMNLNWDIPTTYETFEELYNKTSQSETALQDAIENNINENLGVDFKADIIENLTGRVHYMTYIVPPSRLNSQSTLAAFELNDQAAAEETMTAIFEELNLGERITEVRHEGVTIYQFPGGGQGRSVRVEVGRDGARTGREERTTPQDEFEQPDPFESGDLRRPEPCIAIYGDHLLLTDAVETMKEVISTGEGRGEPLSSDPDFLLMYDEISRQLGGSNAGALIYSRPESILENFYDLAVDQRNRDRLRQAGEDNRVARRLGEVLEETPLPSFDVLRKYMAASGGVMTNDETGFHFFSFEMKPIE